MRSGIAPPDDMRDDPGENEGYQPPVARKPVFFYGGKAGCAVVTQDKIGMLATCMEVWYGPTVYRVTRMYFVLVRVFFFYARIPSIHKSSRYSYGVYINNSSVKIQNTG